MFALFLMLLVGLAGALLFCCCTFLLTLLVDSKGEIKRKKLYYTFVCLFFIWLYNVALEILGTDSNIFIVLEITVLFGGICCIACWLGTFVAKIIIRMQIPFFKTFHKKVLIFCCFAMLTTCQVVYIFGLGYLIPDELRPSYYTQLKALCKLNALPNNEEKYNKILGTLGLNLKTLDYNILQNNIEAAKKDKEGEFVSIVHSYSAYRKNHTVPSYSQISGIQVSIFTQQNYVSPKNIKSMEIQAYWSPTRLTAYRSGDNIVYELRGDFESLNCSTLDSQK